jgi:hypothetical protein
MARKKAYLNLSTQANRVEWYIARGYSTAKILSTLKAQFSGVSTEKVSQAIAFTKAAREKGKRVMGYAPTYKLDLDKLPSSTKDPSFVRGVFNYQFNNPITGKQVTRTAWYDIKPGMSLEEYLSTVKGLIVEDLMAHYDFGEGGVAQASRRVLNLSIVQIEAV